MIGLAPSDDCADHSAPTHPGPYDALISGLPPDIPVLCRILQGLLIQEAWIERNGLNPAAFAGQSRATLSVAQRLEQLLAIDPRPLTTARPGESRALSTCRDFSLMLCGVLRHHGVPARIRCGFGRYFAPHPLHDHGCASTGIGVSSAGSWLTLSWTNYTATSSSSISNPSMYSHGVHHRHRGVEAVPSRRHRSCTAWSRNHDRPVLRPRQLGARFAGPCQD